MIIPLHINAGKYPVAVLTPRDWALIREHCNADYKIRGDFLIHTWMRIREAKLFAERPEYYRKENRAIFLPKIEGMGKKRCLLKNRTITLSDKGVAAVEVLISNRVKFPVYQSMEPAFKLAASEAGFDTRYITTKMFRKTGISWAMSIMPERQAQIAHCAGHTLDTMLGNYLAFGFTKADLNDIRAELTGY